MSMIHRIPSSETVGLKDDFNGPICYTPDGNPLLGPAPGLRNMWLAEGFSFGITAAGGTGHYLAQLMTEGEAEIDMGSLDPRRYGDWMTTEYAARKNEECYSHVYILHHPDEEREACRPLRTAPVYDRQKALGAQFGCVNGFERPNYYGPVNAPDSFGETRIFRSERRGRPCGCLTRWRRNSPSAMPVPYWHCTTRRGEPVRASFAKYRWCAAGRGCASR